MSKTFLVAITALSTALIMVVAYMWFGPGFSGAASPAAAALFDEQQVQEIYQRVSPAVVEIDVDVEEGNSFIATGIGSGFLVDDQGHIATNNHVIEGIDRVRVILSDGTTLQAEVLGRNPANDLAVLKVDPEAVAHIQPVEFGDSSRVQPGQLAIAIGSPFGLEGSITAGIISGVDRSLPSRLGRSISNVLQTDALISPGSSGGPLLNSAGQVVGINTAIQVSPVIIDNRSAGFAVPVNILEQLLPDLKTKQVVRPAWLGVAVVNVDSLLAERLELPVMRGVYVTDTVAGGPADEAGLKASGTTEEGRPAVGGDIIVAVDGVSVASSSQLISLLNQRQPGDQVTLTVVRGGEEVEVPVTLGEWPEQGAPVRQSRPVPPEEWRIPDRRFPFLPDFPFRLPEQGEPHR